MDLAAPRAGRRAHALDEGLEALQVSLDAPLEHTERIAQTLGRPRRLVRDLERDARPVDAKWLEHDRARVRRPRRAAPRNVTLGHLLDDLGLPLLFLAADIRAPAQHLLVELHDLLHALHEPREALELRPLVICVLDRD